MKPITEQQLHADKQRISKLLKQGNIKKAGSILLKICESDIEDAESYYLLGTVYGQLNKLDKAVESFKKAISLQPDVVFSYINLATAFTGLGKLDEAEKTLQDALVIQPKNFDVLLNLGLVLAQSEQYYEAEDYVSQALSINSNSVLALKALGNLFYREQKYSQAVETFSKLNKVDPSVVDSWLSKGNAQFQLGLIEDSIASYLKVVQIDASNIEAHANMGHGYKLLGKTEDTKTSYQKVLAVDSGNITATVGIIDLLEKSGEYEDAYKHLMPLVEMNVEDSDLAASYLRLCEKFDSCDMAISYAEKVLKNNSIADQERGRLEFALGRIYDKRKQYSIAYSYYEKANSLRSQKFSVDGHEKFVRSLIEQYDWQFFSQVARPVIRSQRPVFIVGMPRSGTSLTEQILASHPSVYGAGELSIINDIVQTIDPGINNYASRLLQLSAEEVDKLASKYLDNLSMLNQSAPRVTDKMPSNFFHLGLINILFPDAKIIHCTRNPLDTCLSIYFQDFSESNPYANNLEHCAYFYLQYQKWMNHIKSFLTVPIIDVSYEELVTNQEEMTRKLIHFLELDWNDDCLSFHNTKRFVATPSYDQVREKMYTSSVERWRNYEKHISGVKEILKV